MKKYLLTILSFILTISLLAGCAGKTPTDDGKSIEVKEDIPVKLEYSRYWEYGAFGESEDPEYIKQVLKCISALEIGEETNQGAEDFTDILVFTYADGSTVTYEFEADWIVNEDGTRNMITGGDLSGLRTLLSEMLDIE